MPIKGVSDQRRLTRLGKIRLGIKETSKKGSKYPKAVDYFVVDEDDVTSKQAAEAFHKVYGDKPKELTILFPSNDSTVVFDQWLTAYTKAGLLCKGDGEIARRKDQDGQFHDIRCEYHNCPLYKNNECKELGKLQVILPDVEGLGVWQIDTSSYHSIINLNSGIEMIRNLYGRIAMIPLKLRLVPRVVQPEGMAKKTIYVLELGVEGKSISQMLAQAPTVHAIAPSAQYDAPLLNFDERPSDIFPDGTVSDEQEHEPHTTNTTFSNENSTNSPASNSSNEVDRTEFYGVIGAKELGYGKTKTGEKWTLFSLNDEMIEAIVPPNMLGTFTEGNSVKVKLSNQRYNGAYLATSVEEIAEHEVA